MLWQRKARAVRSMPVIGEFFSTVRCHPLLSILTPVLLAVAVVVRTRQLFDFYSTSHQVLACAADAFVAVDAGLGTDMGLKGIVLLPLFLCMLMVFSKNDSREQYVLRRRSRSTMWRILFTKMIALSLVLSAFLTAITALTGIRMTDKLMNWNEKGSIFWALCRESLDYELTFAKVAFVFFFVIFMTLVFTGAVFLLMQWLFSNMFVGWMLCMGLVFSETFIGGTVCVFYGRVTIGYFLWIENFPLVTLVIGSLAVVLLFTGAGYYFGRRKEFYGK